MAVNICTTSPIYLDYNATCPVAPEVCESIAVALADYYGNPSSLYDIGVAAKEAIQSARIQVALMIGARNVSDIIFTSSGTEANHMAILSAIANFNIMNRRRETSRIPHVIASSIEHPSVKKHLQRLMAARVCSCTFVDPRPFSGHIEVSDIMLAVQQDTCLISVMLANNETGVLQPVKMLAEKIQNTNRFRENKIYIHTDAAQAIGKIVVDVKQLKVDYLTIVGHKFYGPRIGALYVRSLGSLAGAPLLPIFHGGNQENGFRAGSVSIQRCLDTLRTSTV
ncbi:unnamed protein product [Soboliphyme baturini]|uniref:Selenocysteine lyase n=1 Tax=Soboliphyme baturini TaxID=241478 RepID=A0A183J0H9_9BILA|nr:unnamed protein product [Soboliphyme baturini]